MCGIAGWFSSAPVQERELAQLETMTRQLAHRGPDGSGCRLYRHAALGHTRLSIIDLEGGGQPMQSADGAVSISFNGEIYNYRALRKQLLAQGCSFQSHSDTEVVIALYRQRGIEGFRLLRGMYAFALWDSRSATGILCRDPLGIKPLFLCSRAGGERLLFASEAKAIVAHEGIDAVLDTDKLHLLMNFRYLPGQSTLFRDIVQLAPGQVLVWRPASAPRMQNLGAGPDAISDDLLDALRDSVAHHFTADVEVGAYLSGGIDSAAVCALGRSCAGYPLQTFTLNAGDDPNEAANARRSAELLGLSNQCQTIDTEIGKELHHLVWHLEVPKINSLQVSLLARVAAQKVKVCLSGLGGDELFYGYNIHRYLHRAKQLHGLLPGLLHRLPGAAAAWFARSCSRTVFSEAERGGRALSQLGHWPRVYGLLRNLWDDPAMRRLLYGPRMLDEPLTDSYEYLQQQWPAGNDPVAACAEFESRHKLVNDLLWQEDRMSMAHGLEVRVPFVDSCVAGTVQRIPRDRLMPGGRTKHFMREQLRGLLGDEIVDRRKSGFQVDAAAFYRQHLRPLAQVYLQRSRVNEYGLFNYAFINDISRLRPRKSLRWHYFILYLMILTHIWIELFEKRKPYDECW